MAKWLSWDTPGKEVSPINRGKSARCGIKKGGTKKAIKVHHNNFFILHLVIYQVQNAFRKERMKKETVALDLNV